MNILVASMNYKSTPVEIREKFSFQDDIHSAVKKLSGMDSVLECVILSTCNRTEIYLVVEEVHTGFYDTKLFLSQWFNISIDSFSSYLIIKENEQAIEHLFRVACGLDSMVLGETQILGQVREAFIIAQKEIATGSIFNRLFQQAITLAKRAHTETAISENAVSVSYAAIELGKKVFGAFKNKAVLLLGAGKMSELTAKNLVSNGSNQITVLNRTYEKALVLAEKFDGVAKGMSDLNQAIYETDILISSVRSREYVVTKGMLEKIMVKRKGHPLFIIDIAVPRNVDPAVRGLADVFLYDIDDLQHLVVANIEERKREGEKVEELIEGEMLQFIQWLNSLEVVPLISALHHKGISIQEETMNSLERKLTDLTDREKKVINKHMSSIVNQLLREPILAMKELAEDDRSEEMLRFIAKAFAIEDQLENQEKDMVKINQRFEK